MCRKVSSHNRPCLRQNFQLGCMCMNPKQKNLPKFHAWVNTVPYACIHAHTLSLHAHTLAAPWLYLVSQIRGTQWNWKYPVSRWGQKVTPPTHILLQLKCLNSKVFISSQRWLSQLRPVHVHDIVYNTAFQIFFDVCEISVRVCEINFLHCHSQCTTLRHMLNCY